MATFRYLARDASGARKEGTLEARDRAQAIDRLKAQNLIVTELVEGGRGGPLLPSMATLRGRRLSARGLAVMTRELAALLTAGLPMTRALDLLVEDAENPEVYEALIRIKHAVEGGQTFSAALRQHSRFFPAFYANLVEAGEHSGELPRVLDRLATYVEWVEGMRRRASGALVYPAMVVTFSLALVAGLIIFVLPRFTEIYRGLGADLPWPTAALLAVTEWVGRYGLVLLGVGAVAGFLVRRVLSSERGQVWLNTVALKLPFVGNLVARFSITRFARTLAMMYQGGIPILTALEVSARTCGNLVYYRALLVCREAVGSGTALGAALRATRLFPSVMVSMVDVGERSGNLVDMLERIAEFYEAELNVALESMASILEPLLIVWVGALIGGLVLVLFLPIMNLQQLL